MTKVQPNGPASYGLIPGDRILEVRKASPNVAIKYIFFLFQFFHIVGKRKMTYYS